MPIAILLQLIAIPGKIVATLKKSGVKEDIKSYFELISSYNLSISSIFKS